MGKCSGCGVYAHNIRTCPGVVRKNKTDPVAVKSLCKTKKSCIACNKKGHTFESCKEFERILPEYLETWGLEAPSPIYPTSTIEDVWIDVL